MPFFKSIEHAGLTDVGSKRSHNQDAFFVQKASDRAHWETVGHLYIVADGMGGHAVGEKASAKAVQEIPLTYVKHVQDGPVSALRRAFQEANAGIHAIGTSNPEFKGLGTTATGLVLRAEGAWIGHVGDSRAYRIRDQHIQQLTYDHSYAWEMAKRLGIPPEELGDIKKNVIVRSLGPGVFLPGFTVSSGVLVGGEWIGVTEREPVGAGFIQFSLGINLGNENRERVACLDGEPHNWNRSTRCCLRPSRGGLLLPQASMGGRRSRAVVVVYGIWVI